MFLWILEKIQLVAIFINLDHLSNASAVSAESSSSSFALKFLYKNDECYQNKRLLSHTQRHDFLIWNTPTLFIRLQ